MSIPKLYQWLTGVGSFMTVWLACVCGYIQPDISEKFKEVIAILPLYLLITFACYSLAVIGYRVATFNDCEDASEELKQQIKEAQLDLEKKGYKYATDWK